MKRILAIDPGTNIGWATNYGGTLRWGRENFAPRKGRGPGSRWTAFSLFLRQIEIPRPDLVVYEAQLGFGFAERRASDITFGFSTRVEEFADRLDLECRAIHNASLKAFALPLPNLAKGEKRTGKMDRSKEAMIAAAKRRLLDSRRTFQAEPWYEIMTEHEADALWLLWYAEEKT